MSVVRPVSPVRLIDPRGHRFGAALSAVILGLALAAGVQVLVVAIALALGTSALFGTRYSVLGRPWPLVRRVLALGPAVGVIAMIRLRAGSVTEGRER